MAHDLTEAYCACEDYARDENESEEARAVREHASTVLTLREWYDLNPSMEFRCFVKSKNLIAVAQRHVNDYFEFLAREKDAIEDAIATFWEANVSTTSWHDEQVDYVFDAYVTPKQKKVKIIDFNVWGGTTLPLLFDWHELETIGAKQPSGGDARGYADDIEFRIIESQGNILPGLQLGAYRTICTTCPRVVPSRSFWRNRGNDRRANTRTLRGVQLFLEIDDKV